MVLIRGRRGVALGVGLGEVCIRRGRAVALAGGRGIAKIGRWGVLRRVLHGGFIGRLCGEGRRGVG